MQLFKRKLFDQVQQHCKIWNEQKNNIMKVVKSLEESGLLIRGVSEAFENEGKS